MYQYVHKYVCKYVQSTRLKILAQIVQKPEQ